MFCPESISLTMNEREYEQLRLQSKTKHVYDTMLEYCICIYMYLYLHSHLNLYLFCVQVGHLLCLANARSHASQLIHVWR